MTFLISVVVPIYNVEKYLPKCIESIINQTYSKLEIILVNDGSSDKSGEICDIYAKQDHRIVVIHKDNGGLSEARNTGIDVAKGEYISFIDSDDFIHEKFYEKLIRLMIKNNADIVQSQFQRIYVEDNSKYETAILNNGESEIILNKVEALNNLYNSNYVSTVIICNKLYKKELFKDIRFPIGKLHEDEYTTYKLLYKSEQVVLTSDSMYFYLQRSESIMGRTFNTKRLDALEAYSNQMSFFNEAQLFELEIKAAQRLEVLIRDFMTAILNSELKNKKQLFDYLVKYYRKFNLYSYFQGKGKVKVYIFQSSPTLLIKCICRILNIKNTIINKYLR